jgi:hypothetical protein
MLAFRRRIAQPPTMPLKSTAELSKLQASRSKPGTLTAAKRAALPASKFALPGGRYPIENAAHARNALSRVAQFGTPAEKSAVRSKVKKLYPGIDQGAK